MEQKEDQTSIQISNPNNPVDEFPSAQQQSTLPAQTYPAQRAMAKGVQGTLSMTSVLANWLPTRTLLTFETILPSVVGNGLCTPVKTTMMIILLCLCGASCFFFHFTDSFRGPDGTVYYGYVTPRGLAVFKPDLHARQQQWEQERNQFSNMSTSLRFKALHLHFSNKNTDNPQAKYVPFIFRFAIIR
ncbi:hypothetical protein MKW94_028184 [Papaver nudicaule]|uniref:Uncharacterized protein n=1 Tax=Papaver nudicaule TaxID=74823 RepID=A0AA41SE53_PAPNU|nr:hypothetical protein [Papaver nudicaule]